MKATKGVCSRCVLGDGSRPRVLPVVAKLSVDQLEHLGRHPPGKAVALALSECCATTMIYSVSMPNKRSIIFRFAMYLQPQFPDWTVDCEFNRDGVEPIFSLGHEPHRSRSVMLYAYHIFLI